MNFLKHCSQHRWIRIPACIVITLVTLWVLLCSWVNWSGARQWKATQAMLKSEGETLDFHATMNDPIAEDENFCAIPLLKDLALVVDNDTSKGAPAEKRKRLEALKLPSESKGGPRPKLSNAALGKKADLKLWADWLRTEGSLPMPADSGDAARDILAALSKNDAIFQELAAGINRPKAQWTPEWKTRELPRILFDVQLPHYSGQTGLCQTLALRSIAAARAGDAAKAHESALIMARLSEANLNDPFLIGLLMGVSGTSMFRNVTWELCDAHAGTAEDFTRLEAALAKLDFHPATLRAMRSEMAGVANAVQYLKDAPAEAVGLFEMMGGDGTARGGPNRRMVKAIPSGFFDSSGAVLADREFRCIIKPLRDGGLLQDYRAANALENEIVEMKRHVWTHPSWIITELITPVISSVIGKVIYTQALVDQSRIACALERYRIANGNYPDSLDTIILANGKPLPLDLMNGKPMGYRKTAEGRYALWSAGVDGKDDGGKRALDEKHPETTKFQDPKYVGDWVWDFPKQ